MFAEGEVASRTNANKVFVRVQRRSDTSKIQLNISTNFLNRVRGYPI
jgi:hypothetical protein